MVPNKRGRPAKKAPKHQSKKQSRTPYNCPKQVIKLKISSEKLIINNASYLAGLDMPSIPDDRHISETKLRTSISGQSEEQATTSSSSALATSNTKLHYNILKDWNPNEPLSELGFVSSPQRDLLERFAQGEVGTSLENDFDKNLNQLQEIPEDFYVDSQTANRTLMLLDNIGKPISIYDSFQYDEDNENNDAFNDNCNETTTNPASYANTESLQSSAEQSSMNMVGPLQISLALGDYGDAETIGYKQNLDKESEKISSTEMQSTDQTDNCMEKNPGPNTTESQYKRICHTLSDEERCHNQNISQSLHSVSPQSFCGFSEHEVSDVPKSPLIPDLSDDDDIDNVHTPVKFQDNEKPFSSKKSKESEKKNDAEKCENLFEDVAESHVEKTSPITYTTTEINKSRVNKATTDSILKEPELFLTPLELDSKLHNDLDYDSESSSSSCSSPKSINADDGNDIHNKDHVQVNSPNEDENNALNCKEQFDDPVKSSQNNGEIEVDRVPVVQENDCSNVPINAVTTAELNSSTNSKASTTIHKSSPERACGLWNSSERPVQDPRNRSFREKQMLPPIETIKQIQKKKYPPMVMEKPQQHKNTAFPKTFQVANVSQHRNESPSQLNPQHVQFSTRFSEPPPVSQPNCLSTALDPIHNSSSFNNFIEQNMMSFNPFITATAGVSRQGFNSEISTSTSLMASNRSNFSVQSTYLSQNLKLFESSLSRNSSIQQGDSSQLMPSFSELMRTSPPYYNLNLARMQAHTSNSEIAKMFGITCMKYLANECSPNATCNSSHNFCDYKSVRSLLDSLSRFDLIATYNFVSKTQKLFFKFFHVYIEIFIEKRDKNSLSRIFVDGERYELISDKILIEVFKGFQECGHNKKVACDMILALSRRRTSYYINMLMVIILEADWVLFVEPVLELLAEPDLILNFDVIENMAISCNNRFDNTLVNVISKALSKMDIDEFGKIKNSHLIRMMKKLMPNNNFVEMLKT